MSKARITRRKGGGEMEGISARKRIVGLIVAAVLAPPPRRRAAAAVFPSVFCLGAGVR